MELIAVSSAMKQKREVAVKKRVCQNVCQKRTHQLLLESEVSIIRRSRGASYEVLGIT